MRDRGIEIMKKILFLGLFTLFVLCVYKTDVKALSGSGTAASPYLVTSGTELTEALSKGTSSWKYIAITDTAAITKMITVSKGKFRIYAKGANRTLRRSRDLSADINSASKPKRCIKIDGSTEIEWGYNATSYTLYLEGSKDVFTSRVCNEWFYVGENAKMTIGSKAHFRNAKCNVSINEGSPIRCYGMVDVYGEVSYCDGRNGGAIKVITGTVNIFSGAKIHNCTSETEGGAVYGKDFADITMNSGLIYNNTAAEEGGGIFATNSVVYIYAGSIYRNTAGKTGGGVFSGNEGSLYFGKDGSGPNVYENNAKNAGGGIRCNGGSDVSGGYSEFAGGNITNNHTDTSGGGISVGNPSSGHSSKIQISDLSITNNTASNTGGGICFSEGVKGKTTDEIPITKTTVTGNSANTAGGGIQVLSIVKIINCTIKNNESAMGGGVNIASAGTLKMPSSFIELNKATKGSGVAVNGIFEVSSAGYVNENNTVFLATNKHIDVTGYLTVSKSLVSNIDPEVKTKGTILVDVTYSGGTADSELYFTGSSAEKEARGESVKKKFITTGNHMLRPATKNTEIASSRYIIISDKYTIKYNGNSLDSVANVPDDEIAFWKETFYINNNIVSRVGFVLNNNKHWNLSADGTGDVHKPGTGTLFFADTTLYAIWENLAISSLTMTTCERYYVVGQKITLTAEELLKKVIVENDLNIDVSYDIKVTEIIAASGIRVAKGDDLITENYINTSEARRFKLILFTSTPDGTVTCTGEMHVTILEDYYDKTEVRFISSEFVDTLNPRSKWKRHLKNKLNQSLNNENNYIYTVELENDDVVQIRNNIKSNGYKIDHGVNSLVTGKVVG